MLYELTDVSLSYEKDFTLTIPSLRIERGERVALLGPNGAGKTSLLKILDGLVSPQRGSVLRSGKPAEKSTRPVPRSVYLHQHPYLLSGSVKRNIAFGCRAADMDSVQTRNRTDEAIALLGLEAIADRKFARLSGGEAQRVALARALAAGAEILLLDEPAASADMDSASLIGAALRRCAERGATIIFSTHDERFAEPLATRTIRMEAGTIASDSRGAA